MKHTLFYIALLFSLAVNAQSTLRTLNVKPTASFNDTLLVQNGTTQAMKVSTLTNLINAGNLSTANAALLYQPKGNYLTSFTEADPVFLAHVAHNITSTNIANWNSAFGWGNHAGLYPATQRFLDSVTALRAAIGTGGSGSASFTETDPTVGSHIKSITTTEKGNWNTAFGWGNHALAGYLTSASAASYVPANRTLTINGTTLDLSANRTFTIATNVGSVAWGSITGTLSGQTDLQAALNTKQNTITTGTTSQYFRGDLSLATFPAIPAAIDTTPLGNRLTSVINTTNANVAANTSAIASKQNTITTGTTAQYLRGDLSLATFPTIPASVDTSGLGARVTSNTNTTNANVAANATAISNEITSRTNADNLLLPKSDSTIANRVTANTNSINTHTTQIAAKLNITDTANMRLRVTAGANMSITGTYPYLTFASAGGGGGSADSINFASKYYVDTVKTNLRNSVTGGTSVTDRLVPLIVFSGESNSGGFADNSDATTAELAPRSNVQILNNNTLLFEDLDVGTNNLLGHGGFASYVSTKHGWELELANQVAGNAFMTNKVYLVKTGQGGSTITDWNTGGSYWTSMIQRIDSAISLLRSQGKIPIIYLWYSQGLNDNLAGVQASIWETATIAHFKKIRAKWGYVPIIMTRLPGLTYDAAITDIATNDPYVYPIQTSDAQLQGDGAHWTYAGIKLISQRMTATSTNTVREYGSYLETQISKNNTRLADLKDTVALKQIGLQYKSEGVNVGTAGSIGKVNFIGSGVATTKTGDTLTVAITGGGSGGSTTLTTSNIGFGSAANQVTGSSNLTWDNTLKKFRIGYDASNYLEIQNSSTGAASLKLSGSAPSYTISVPAPQSDATPAAGGAAFGTSVTVGVAAAFDDNVGTYGETQFGTIGYQFTSAKVITKYTITPSNVNYPVSYTFQGSNDGTNWTNIDVQSGLSWAAGTKKTFTVANSTGFTYYRFANTNNESSNGYVRYTEIELMEATSFSDAATIAPSGIIPFKLTKAQRNALVSPVAGSVIYQTDNVPGLRVYNGTNWMKYTETID